MAEKNCLQIFIRIIFIITTINSFSCSAQKQDINITKSNKMKMFDIQKFEGKKDKKGEFSIVEKDSVTIQKKGENNTFLEIKYQIDKKNHRKRIIYFSDGNLGGESETFLNLKIGKHKGYNEDGDLSFEQDYTRPNFKFTVEQLAEKMLKDYGIDMYNADNVRLVDSTRLDNEGNSIVEWWVIVETREDNTYTFKTYRIDGTTGELISIENGAYGGTKG